MEMKTFPSFDNVVPNDEGGFSGQHFKGEIKCIKNIATVSDVLRASIDTEVYSPYPDPEELVFRESITIPSDYIAGSVFRVKFDMYGNASYPAHARIYKNGVAHGTLYSNETGAVWVTKSEDLGFSPGDTCEIWACRGNIVVDNASGVKNFRIYCDNEAVITGIDPTWS